MYKIKADTQRNILTRLRTRKYSFPRKSCHSPSACNLVTYNKYANEVRLILKEVSGISLIEEKQLE